MWVSSMDDDDAPRRPPEPPDGLTLAAGTHWYATRWVVNECRLRIGASTTTGFPERFDRFYPQAKGGPLLVDILTGDRSMRAEQERAKHVQFKRAWCAEHGHRYLVVTEDDMVDEARLRELVAALDRGPDDGGATARVSRPRERAERQRGRVHRPQAAAA